MRTSASEPMYAPKVRPTAVACDDTRKQEAEAIRARFMPLADLRDAWGPARVLHHATALADVAPTMLDLMGLPQPAEMTGRSLLHRAGANE